MPSSSSAPGPAKQTGPPDSPGIRLLPGLHYALGLLAGLLLSRAFPTPWLPGPASTVVSIAFFGCAAALGVSALWLFVRSRTSFMPHRPASALVVEGPYRFTRNPMYVGLALIYLGIAVAVESLWAVLLLPAVIYSVNTFVIAREEAYLERRFGHPYLHYKQRVRRWL